MSTASVSVAQRRRRLVRRHLLGSDGRAARGCLDVARALGPLHSTDPATPYLSIHARSDVSIGDVDVALYDAVSLRRFTTIRRTVFAMDPDVAPSAYAAVNRPLVDTLRRQLIGWLGASDDVEGDPAAFLTAVESRVVEHLADHGSLTGAQLAQAVPDLGVRFDPKPGASYSRPQRITSKVLEILGMEMRIVRSRPTGVDLTSGAWRWAAADPAWRHEVAQLRPEDALARLLSRYLDACAPATVTDMTWWTGTTKTRVRRAMADLGAVEVDLLDADEPGFLPVDDPWARGGGDAGDGDHRDGCDDGDGGDTDRGPSVALLPGLDSTTMAWKQRSWYVDDSVGAGVFDRNGNAGPTIWVDGRVVGVWTQRADGRIVTEVLDDADVPTQCETEIAAEGDRIAEWLGEVRVNWRYPTPITKRLEA